MRLDWSSEEKKNTLFNYSCNVSIMYTTLYCRNSYLVLHLRFETTKELGRFLSLVMDQFVRGGEGTCIQTSAVKREQEVSVRATSLT